MQLVFERGNRDAPVGHALIYFRGDDGSILATYVTVPPIKFDLAKFVPGFLSSAIQGMDLGDAMVATPMPPIPEEVPGLEYLETLADRRQDDLVFAGGTYRSDPMRLAAEASEAAREYGDLYGTGAPAEDTTPTAPTAASQSAPFADLTESEKLDELTRLTGRLRDSVSGGASDQAVEQQMAAIASSLPAKYRAGRLVEVARVPGDRAQRLAQLYLERCYKLYNEDYLDLARIDREIDALAE